MRRCKDKVASSSQAADLTVSKTWSLLTTGCIIPHEVGLSKHWGDRGRWISLFKASLVYRISSWASRAMQRISFWKNVCVCMCSCTQTLNLELGLWPTHTSHFPVSTNPLPSTGITGSWVAPSGFIWGWQESKFRPSCLCSPFTSWPVSSTLTVYCFLVFETKSHGAQAGFRLIM